ncbi:uncharacterized protein LOC141858797 [Brevipalpus obovatus]|uniref:uncharacterized protein LOC141858797 n=1 Tax=Brevipalpus obovatus TaxID=246614 RepID=UPI003D9FA1E7
MKLLVFILLILGIIALTIHSKENSQDSDRMDNLIIKSGVSEKSSSLLLSGFSKVFWDSMRIQQQEKLNTMEPNRCIGSFKAILDMTNLGYQPALKILTSSGRLPRNFFKRSMADFGSYDQCLESDLQINLGQVPTVITGQYCLAALEPNSNHMQSHGAEDGFKLWSRKTISYPHEFDRRYNLSVHIGFCVPSTCSSTELERLMNQAFEPYSWELVKRLSCEGKQNFSQKIADAPINQKVSLAFLCALISTIFLGTILSSTSKIQSGSSSGKFMKFIKCFSVQGSMRTLLSKPNPHRVVYLDNLRIIIYLSVLFLHTGNWHTGNFVLFFTSFYSTPPVFENWTMQPVLNVWPFEGQIILGAITWLVNIWGKTTKNSPISVYISSIFKKMRDYLLPLTVVICIMISLPLLGSGPVHKSLTEFRSDACSENFMYSLLYATNFASHSTLPCAVPTWSMSVEMQLFLVSCLVIYSYKRYPKVGLYLNLFLLIFGALRLFLIFYSNDIPPRSSVMPFKLEITAKYMRTYHTTFEGHIFGYMFSLLVVRTIFSRLDEKLSKNTLRKVMILTSLTTVVLMFSTGIWNVLNIEVSRLWTAIYAVIYKFGIVFFWATIHFSKAEILRASCAVSSDDMNCQNLSKEMGVGQKSLSRLWDHISTVALRILKASYFIHDAFLVWYLAQRREGFPSDPFSYIMMFWGMILGCLASGILFYFLALGPVESILSSKREELSGKSHSS